MSFVYFILFLLILYFLVKFLKRMVSSSLLPYSILGVYLLVLLISLPIAYISAADDDRSSDKINTEPRTSALKTMLQNDDLSEFQMEYETAQTETVTSISFDQAAEMMDMHVFISEHEDEEVRVFSGPLMVYYSGFEKNDHDSFVASVDIENENAIVSLDHPSQQNFNIIGNPLIHGEEHAFSSEGGHSFASTHVLYLQVPENTAVEEHEGQFIVTEYIDN